MINNKSRLTDYLDRHYYVYYFKHIDKYMIVKDTKDACYFVDDFSHFISIEFGYKINDIGIICTDWFINKKRLMKLY